MILTCCHILTTYIGVETEQKATCAFNFLQQLLKDLGLEESDSKACPPARVVTCLGVEFNTVSIK